VRQISADEENIITYDLSSLSSDLSKKIMVFVHLGNKRQNFKVDTGSPVSLLSGSDFDKLSIARPIIVKCPNVRFRVYNNEMLYPEG